MPAQSALLRDQPARIPCIAPPDVAFCLVESPKIQFPISYRDMFYLCSLSIRINGAQVEMTSLNRLTAIAVACLGMIATSSQQVRAQDFTLFEHAIVPPKTDQQPARQYLPAIYQQGQQTYPTGKACIWRQ